VSSQEFSRGIGQVALDFAGAIDEVRTADEIKARFQRFIEGLGFSSVICFNVPEPGEMLERCIHLSTRPQGWIDHYTQRGYVRFDPVVLEARRTRDPYTWSEVLTRREMGPAERLIQSEREEAGLKDALVVPIFEANGGTGMVSIAGERPMSKDVRHTLELAGILTHNRLIALGRANRPIEGLLTPREIECLRWAADGKSDWEIGQILLISAKTVNYHIENSKRKFGVTSRTQACIAAYRYKLLI
jgi:LuxR family quorum sensing-dependent transcriptional regulator